MSTPLFSVGGLVSGLDTTDIISQLMALERQPKINLQRRQDDLRRTDEAWGGVVAQLSNLRAAVDKLRDPTRLASATQVTSSNDGVAVASRNGNAQPGQVALEVDALATAHRVALDATFGAGNEVIGAGTFTVNRQDGTELSVTLGEGATVADLARALNDLDGLSAALVRTGDDAFRLVVSSSQTGAAGRFTVATDGFDGLSAAVSVLNEGGDARLFMGTMEITRSSNVIDDLIDGVQLRLTGTGSFTVNVEQDLDAGVGLVTELVTQLNAVLDHLAEVGKTSAVAEERGALAGDSLVRSLALELRGVFSQTQVDGPYRTTSQIGLSLTRNGRVELDEEQLREALAADPGAVGALLGRVGGASDNRVEVSAFGRAQPGSYSLQLDQSARVAAATGAAFFPPGGDPKTYSIIVNGKTITVTADADDSPTSIVAKLNAAMALETLRIRAEVEEGPEGPQLTFASTRAGTAGDFTIVDNPGEGVEGLGFAAQLDTATSTGPGVVAGQGAAGTLTFAGQTFELTSAGRTFSVTEGPGRGLVFTVPTEVTGELGAISVSDGLTGVLDRVLHRAEGLGGSVANRRQAIAGRIQATQTSIDAFDVRLEMRERALRNEFTRMETMLAQHASQANWLASQLAGMFG